jgi:hypothetical protein
MEEDEKGRWKVTILVLGRIWGDDGVNKGR